MVQNKTAWKHGAARAVKAIFAVLGALTIVFFAFFGGEFSTLKTLNRVEDDANLFTMEYKADYALDRFLKIGVPSASFAANVEHPKFGKSNFSGIPLRTCLTINSISSLSVEAPIFRNRSSA